MTVIIYEKVKHAEYPRASEEIFNAVLIDKFKGAKSRGGSSPDSGD